MFASGKPANRRVWHTCCRRLILQSPKMHTSVEPDFASVRRRARCARGRASRSVSTLGPARRLLVGGTTCRGGHGVIELKHASLAADGAMGIACAIAPGRKSANTTLRSSNFSLRTSGARRDRERSISEAAASMVSSPSSNATCGSLQAVRVPTRMPRAVGLGGARATRATSASPAFGGQQRSVFSVHTLFILSLAFGVMKQRKADMAYRSRAHRHPAHSPHTRRPRARPTPAGRTFFLLPHQHDVEPGEGCSRQRVHGRFCS